MTFYKRTCIATSALFLLLFIQLMAGAESFVSDMGLVPCVASSVIARRAAIFMLGISVLLFLARNLPYPDVRRYVGISTAVTLFGLACMGVYEYVMGRVNNSIFFAITVETVLGLLFTIAVLKDRVKGIVQ